ncbi:cell wall-binding repeat-containing protein [Conexibacter stalactiti]|uniref:Cell wall-binding repeat-containing protein n=1 Tax=Conexibacter stalactiti TaxID=1940611 RepID=A0ABU4HYV3_9ACTN|nr:cell wall-binding repeat-containing protein [Conexibacter stalactiti]MDW5598478.1 cell wall-binding repeat-containing protein [Conexibacter stalactiti]MEC5039120.1 cell wall-binding repeat-containing protein [Conexibacter stalactiti]
MLRRRLALAGLLLSLTTGLAACGGGDDDGGKTTTIVTPQIGSSGDEPEAVQQLGFPGFATKNTTRVGGSDSIASAAAAARAVYPGGAPNTQPPAVAVVDQDSWQAGLAAAVLMSRPLRAPILLSDGRSLPEASEEALRALAPTGVSPLGGMQVVRVGSDTPAPAGFRSTTIEGDDPAALAAAVDRFQSAASGRATKTVMVVSSEDPAFAMPAAAYAAKSGTPILFVSRDTIPGATFAALQAHGRPRMYLLGPETVISARVERALRGLGRVTRISGEDAVRNAIAFARYSDGSFGWGVVDPGHGLVFANDRRPADAAAAAPLSASGTYGPLLLLDDATTLPLPLGEYLLDIQPGYERDPVRGVYNHAWLIGDEAAITLPVQSRIDSLLEISPVRTSAP